MIRFSFVRKDGSVEQPHYADLDPVDQLYIGLTQAIGVPRIDARTLPEFERRVRLFEAHVQDLYAMDGKATPLPIRVPEGFVALVSNAAKISKRDFDASVNRERVARERQKGRME